MGAASEDDGPIYFWEMNLNENGRVQYSFWKMMIKYHDLVSMTPNIIICGTYSLYISELNMIGNS